MPLPRITIYTTSYCPYCVRAKRLLDGKGVPYEEIDVAGDPRLRAWLADQTGQSTVPQIFVGDRPLGGFGDLEGLDRAGLLDPMLGDER
jgi:glutaredoxin 3